DDGLNVHQGHFPADAAGHRREADKIDIGVDQGESNRQGIADSGVSVDQKFPPHCVIPRVMAINASSSVWVLPVNSTTSIPSATILRSRADWAAASPVKLNEICDGPGAI